LKLTKKTPGGSFAGTHVACLEYKGFFAAFRASISPMPLAKTVTVGRLLGHTAGLRATEKMDIGFLDETLEMVLIARLSLACV